MITTPIRYQKHLKNSFIGPKLILINTELCKKVYRYTGVMIDISTAKVSFHPN